MHFRLLPAFAIAMSLPMATSAVACEFHKQSMETAGQLPTAIHLAQSDLTTEEMQDPDFTPEGMDSSDMDTSEMDTSHDTSDLTGEGIDVDQVDSSGFDDSNRTTEGMDESDLDSSGIEPTND